MEVQSVVSFLLFLQAVNGAMRADFFDCQTASTCSDCIAMGPRCSWCNVLEYKDNKTRGGYYKKCDWERNHIQQGCSSIHNPKSNVEVVQGDLIDDETRVTPQAIKVALRPGQAATFEIKIQTPKNFPIDLYHLMDLSESMADDLEQMKSIGRNLFDQMKDLTSNFKFGFGGYVDKPLAPYTTTFQKEIESKKVDFPFSQYTFSYKNYLPLTGKVEDFNEAIGKVNISYNIDGPEGSLEALMQVMKCTDAIGWREKRKARRIILITTDQTFHYSGDGILGGIVRPNDEQCLLKDGKEYTGWNKYDYPSLSQIRSIIIDNQIVPIFASLGHDQLYRNVAEFFGEASGAVAQRLAADSSNLFPIIERAYSEIAKKASVLSAAPDDINVKIATNCGIKGKPVEQSACTNIEIGQEVIFNVAIDTDTCVTGTKRFVLKTDFEDIDVEVEGLCSCSCEAIQLNNSTLCAGVGTLSCGMCHCNTGFAGRGCQCTEEERRDETMCRVPGMKGSICSGRGDCDCGECICNPIQKDEDTGLITYTHGYQCQCSNTTCPISNIAVCGGPMRGSCGCADTCVCTSDWRGTACENFCEDSSTNCVGDDGAVCGGKGRCECNRCVCNYGYSGELCDQCVAKCPDPCDDYSECVKCRVFETSDLNADKCDEECGKYNISKEYSMVEDIPQSTIRCVARDNDDCAFIFSFNKTKTASVRLTVKEERICPAETDILAIILGVIGSIIGIGLALLLIWRVLATIQDRTMATLNENKAQPQWDAAENPIYAGPTSTIQNPIYVES